MEWNLKSLTISFQEWGEFKGMYVGKIEFTNGSKDAFTFTLSNEETADYLSVIANKVGLSASHLGQKIVESLKFLPTPDKPLLEIKESGSLT
jgi:hypothetical protein